MGKKFIGLSIDGGGYRGIIPAYFIKKLEEDKKTRAYNLFDMLVGTSTGGIICSAVAKGISGTRILNLYLKEGVKIFKSDFKWRIISFFGIFGPKYSNKKLIQIINKYLGYEKIQNSKVDFVVTAYNVFESKSVLFRSWIDKEYTFSDVAIATSSAPTYFPNYKSFVDGGIFANNPALILLIEALKFGHSIEDIIIISIGTGTHSYGFDPKNWGVKEWLIKKGDTPLLNSIFKSQSDFVNQKLSYILGDNFIRLDIEIPEDIRKLDKTEDKNKILQFAQKLIRTEEYNKILKIL